jgi:hypothetical protein
MQNEPMMIRFVGNEMTLKITLLLCDLIVTINALVPCVTSLRERFQSSIISIATCVTFSTNAKLCCHINYLSAKDENASKRRSVWVRTIVDLPPLIVMGNKKQGVSFEDKVGPF